MTTLAGQTAIVTGGAKRIGKAIALSLAEAGVDVLIHYGNSSDAAEETADLIRDFGVKAATVSADLCEPKNAAETIFSACESAFGRPSILVNSAAIFEAGTVQDSSPENWHRHQAINLEAPFALTQRFAKQVAEDHRGSIVNIIDWRSQVHPAGHLAYTISKTGLLALTRIAAQDLAPLIRVNGIAPGPMLPPPGKDAAYLEPVVEKLPLQRSGDPNDIAEAVLYLCRAEFVTGTLLHVDGGQQFTGGKA